MCMRVCVWSCVRVRGCTRVTVRVCMCAYLAVGVAGAGQWIGEYRCQDTRESDRTDVRRLDLTVVDVNDSHVRVINHFFHQDGAGSFYLEGNFSDETHRLHLATPGGDAWIRRPSLNWYTSDLNGAITDDKLLCVSMALHVVDFSCSPLIVIVIIVIVIVIIINFILFLWLWVYVSVCGCGCRCVWSEHMSLSLRAGPARRFRVTINKMSTL